MKNVPVKSLPKRDGRFRALLGEDGWHRLPQAIRNRFGKKVSGGESVTYQGSVVAMRMNFAGRVLAQVLRLVGSPLPFDESMVGQPAVVVVTEDCESSGQFWVRQYGRAKGFPHIVHSSKRFAGPTGLEEYIGFGIGMSLRVEAEEDALLFKSDRYFFESLGLRIYLPHVFAPGDLVIAHRALGEDRFMFSLDLNHPLFGSLIQQDALFQDAVA